MPFGSASSDRTRTIRRTGALPRSARAIEALTPREQEVFGLVTSGLMNKQIAGEMSVSEITVKVHRGNVMRKMGARSLADLVRMADTLGVSAEKAIAALHLVGSSVPIFDMETML